MFLSKCVCLFNIRPIQSLKTDLQKLEYNVLKNLKFILLLPSNISFRHERFHSLSFSDTKVSKKRAWG